MTRASASSPRLHGIVVVDKPAGWTSHNVVARLRRLLGERQIGHGGTLDPAATGVLPLAVGDATKVVEYLSDAAKTYLADVTLGVETDSHDLDGHVVRVIPADHIQQADIESALKQFQGPIDQIPPMHSALKMGGRRLYDLARAGLSVDRPARQVIIYELKLMAWSPPTVTLCIDCSKGTYIRSIARDLGDVLGVGAYLSNLVRVRTGPFSLADAWTLAELEATDLIDGWPSIAIHPDEVTRDQSALLLGAEATAVWRNGGSLRGTDPVAGPVRVYDPEGEWLGVGRYDDQTASWRPVKVIRMAA